MGTYGRDFENAVVTHIIKDNLAEDGERYGDQKVEIKITKGTYKGQNMEATSPNGTLFGAECKKGMRVIVILSISALGAVMDVSVDIASFLLCQPDWKNNG